MPTGRYAIAFIAAYADFHFHYTPDAAFAVADISPSFSAEYFEA
jgi:hypothetical protein